MQAAFNIGSAGEMLNEKERRLMGFRGCRFSVAPGAFTVQSAVTVGNEAYHS